MDVRGGEGQLQRPERLQLGGGAVAAGAAGGGVRHVPAYGHLVVVVLLLLPVLGVAKA